MDESRNMARTMVVGLLYPAVLGSLVYSFLEIVIPSLASDVPSGFLQGSRSLVGIKLLLFLITVGFYCADYIYSSWVAVFRYQFFLLDVVVVLGLYLSVHFINLSSTRPPALAAVGVCFALILACYWLWDRFEPKRQEHKRFYSRMLMWQMSSFAMLGALGLIATFFSFSNLVLAAGLCSALLAMTAWFWGLLWLKRRLGAY